MNHEINSTTDAALVLDVLGLLMARLIELDVIDLDDAVEIERRAKDSRRRATH